MHKVTLYLLAAAMFLSLPVVAAPTAYLTTSNLSFPKSPYTVNLNGNLSEWADYGITSNFNTFCVESTVVFYTNTTYHATIDDTIMNSQIALGDSTKQLYAAYLNDSLAGVNANDIQASIWESVGMPKPSGAAGTSFLASFQSEIGSYDITGWENVKVLNLWKYANLTGDVQSQLVRVAPVPAPGAILLAGIGTTLVGWLRRRRAV